jgi:hypothetical protein
MTIPRRKKISFEYLFDWPKQYVRRSRWSWLNTSIQLAISLTCFSIIIIPVVVDTLIWIFVIVVGAANMLIGGLYEAHLDYRIVKYIKEMSADGNTSEKRLELQRELLVSVVSGNLMLEEGSPQTTIPRSLTTTDSGDKTRGLKKSQSRLLNLLGAQTSFGSAVGSPVIFFLGAFIYTILDLKNDPSSEDAAISLGFGMEWMIIVHVAIVSGCLLASNNPSTSSGIVGGNHVALPKQRRESTVLQRVRTFSAISREDDSPDDNWEWFCHKILGWSDAYKTEFQPVSLWSRGMNKMKWIRQSKAWAEDEAFRETMRITPWGWIIKVFIPTLLLIAVPPAAGGVVAYLTPPRGIGCRSLSFIMYGTCQLIVAILAGLRNAVDDGLPATWQRSTSRSTFSSDIHTNLKYLLTGYSFWLLSSLWWFGSLIAAVGGTTMQVTGIYRNCICYAGAEFWYDIWAKNPPVQLATDTQAARDSAAYWIGMGTLAMAFMVVNCYVGWWYQKLIRRRFTDVVLALHNPSAMDLHNTPTHDLYFVSSKMSKSTPAQHIEVVDFESAGLMVSSRNHLRRDQSQLTQRSNTPDGFQRPNDGARLAHYPYSPGRDSSPDSRMSGITPYDTRSSADFGEDIAMTPLLSATVPKRKPVPRSYNG